MKDKKPQPSDDHAQAKMQVLKELRDMAMGMMGSKLKGLHGVEVMAPDKDGLKQGLDLAKSALPSDEDESADEEASESPQDELDEEKSEEDDHLSPEELDQKIAELQAKRASLR